MWDWSILSVGNNDFFVNWAGIIDFKEILITFNVGGFIFYGIGVIYSAKSMSPQRPFCTFLLFSFKCYF